MAAVRVSCVLYIFMIHGSFGYPSGAPASRCETMGPPGHGGYPQTIVPPYTITLSSQFYNCGENLIVTLRGNTGSFRGFLCQARRDEDDYSTTVGTLAQFETRVVMNQNCGAGRALTHSENGDKNIAEFTWTPFDDYGLVFFVCTIVQTKNIYWVRETLAIVVYSPLGSCLKTPTTNVQISTKYKIRSSAASVGVLTTDSTKSETSSASVYTTDSTKSETTSASAYTTNSNKSDMLSASTYTTDSTKVQTRSASAYTTDSPTENQTNNSRSGVLLISSPSESFYLKSNSSNIQSMSSLGIVGGLSSTSPKTSKNLCPNSAEYIKAHELLMLYSYYFLL